MKALAVIVLLASCISSKPATLPSVRFANAPVAHAVNDRRDVPRPPKNREFARFLYHFDGSFHRFITRSMELPPPQRAQGVNALDEVPDSTWFTNRIGRREVTPEEIRNAPPGGIGSPENHRPWTVLSTKIGTSVGFIIKDARGEKFMLKFDRLGYPDAETGIHIIVGKLLWAAGYNVTDDYIVKFRKEDLILAEDAKIKDSWGNSRPLSRQDYEDRFKRINVDKDGMLRGMASHWLKGKTIGGHSPEGIRLDDPNDKIPHELRRDLRGAFSIWSWLDHVDIQETQFLDVYVEDPANRKRHYVKHYLVDFGKSLGFLGTSQTDRRRGIEYYFDYEAMFKSFISLGFGERRWEDRQTNGPRGWEVFDVKTYEPARWKPSSQVYIPLNNADRYDKFWGAKIVARFKREHIEAAVEAARITDPRVAKHLVDTLVARQQRTIKYWFGRVNPLDEFRTTSDTLCFTDLSLRHGFAAAEKTQYTLTFYDFDARPVGTKYVVKAGSQAETCAALTLARTHNSYTIVRIDTARPYFKGTTYVHLARDIWNRDPNVIGIWRP